VTGVPFTVIANDEASAVFEFSVSSNVSTTERPVWVTAELTSRGPWYTVEIFGESARVNVAASLPATSWIAALFVVESVVVGAVYVTDVVEFIPTGLESVRTKFEPLTLTLETVVGYPSVVTVN
jgi:hypothetical protein